MKDNHDFATDSTIDPGHLDVECVNQPELFFKWAQFAIEASAVMDQAKLFLAVTEAQVEMECRQNPAKFGLVKSTEGAIKAAVQLSDVYQDAYQKYIDARKEAKLCDAGVTAMEQKKRMLEVLATLHGQQYFAGPHVPHDLVADHKEHREKITEQVNELHRRQARKRGGK